MLEIKGLTSTVEDKEILKGLNLTVNRGEVHVIMGPNGAGKSTLANILMGHPKHVQTGGEVNLDGESLNGLRADERAKKRSIPIFPISRRDSRGNGRGLFENS